jgi:iron complex outermembrane receptor protein
MHKPKQHHLLLTVSAVAVLAASSAYAQAPAPAPAEDSTLEEVVVTGSRLTTGFNAPTPVTVVGAQQVEQRAPSNIGEVVNQIPAFRNSSGVGTSAFGIVAGGQNLLDLRGLGATRTLVLINGQRHVPVNSNGTFDTNLIPTSLVERFEVVTGGASAAYGSDAVAGVTNFILKSNLQGLTGSVQYGISQRDDGKEPVFSLGYGTSFAGGKGRFIIGGDYAENSGVDNMYSREWGRKEPGLFALPANRTAGLPSQIFANNVELSTRTYGGIIVGGPLAGTAFDQAGSPFILPLGTPRGGSEMVGTGNYGDAEYSTQQLYTPYERTAALARVEYDITDTVSAFAQLHYGEFNIHTKTLFIPINPNFVIQRDNPYIPASIRAAMVANNLNTVTVNKTGGEWGSLFSGNQIETYQGNFGINGEIFENWRWDLGGTVGKTDSHIELANTPRTADLYQSTHAVLGPNGSIVCGTPQTNPYFLAQPANIRAELISQVSPGCSPMNVFGIGTASDQSINYFNSASIQDLVIKQSTFAANLSGEPLSLPAGPVSLAAGFEWRKDSVDAVGCPDCVAKKLANQNYPSYNASVTVKEAYAEIGVPVIRDAAFAQTLDLNGAVRRADYSTSGGVTTWKVGATWEPNDTFRFRLTRSRDIRAPNISELFDPGSNGKGNVTNRTNGLSGIVDSRTTGNPNLIPEVADTFTTGVVFQPTWEWASGFRLAVDYYKIKIANVVGNVPQQETADRCLVQRIQEFCQFIAFDNSPLGFSGVYSTRVNLDRQETSGIDIEVAYRIPIASVGIPGNLDFRALGTNYRSIKTFQTLPNGTINEVELAGANNSFGGASGLPKWQWNFNLLYNVGRANVGLQARYTSKLKYSTTLIGPDDPTYSPALTNSVNRNVWPETLYFNLNASYELLRDGDRRLQLFGVIDNVLDKDPPIAAMTFLGGSPYNLMGRYFKAGVRFSY